MKADLFVLYSLLAIAALFAYVLLVWICRVAYDLSQWRPRRKSTLPGARVVKP